METSWKQTVSRLSDGDRAARIEAARRLAQATDTPPDAAGCLVRTLDGPFDDELFPWVEAALENITSPPQSQVEPLVAILERYSERKTEPDAAYWAATMLGRIGREASGAVSALVPLLERTDHPQIQLKAAWALGKIGPLAKASLPHLNRTAASAADPRVVIFARQAVQEIDR